MSARAERQQESARLERIRSLSTELDQQRQLAADRGRTQESKASFVLVVVGLVFGFSGSSLSDSQCWLVGLLPAASALAAAVMAVVVLWPRDLKVVAARSLVELWVESEKLQMDLEDYLLASKTTEIESRVKKYEDASPHLKLAFQLLLLSIALLFFSIISNSFATN